MPRSHKQLCDIFYNNSLTRKFIIISSYMDPTSNTITSQKDQPPPIQQESVAEFDFFCDPKGIFSNCLQPVKDLLSAAKQGNELNPSKIMVKNLNFPERTTGNNFCSHFFNAGNQSYYVCQQCSFNSSSFSTMCFCQSCWQPQKHVGHNTYSQVPYSDGAYCDCGRIERIKKQSFCSNHASFEVEIPCEISDEERRSFVSSFISLVQVSISTESDELLRNVCEYLENLNENSVFYNRLTFEVLNSCSQSEKQHGGQKYLLVLSKRNCDLSKLIIHLGGDLKTRMDVVKLICLYSHNGEQSIITNHLSSSTIRQLVNLTVVEKLLDSGFYHEFLFNSIKEADNSKLKPKILSKLHQSKLDAAQNLAEVCGYQHNQISPELAEKILHKIFQFYPSSHKINSFIKCQGQESNPWGEFQQVQTKQESHQNLPFDVRNAHAAIANTLSIIFTANKNRFMDFRSYLLERGFDSQRLEQILYWIPVSIRQVCFNEEERVSIVAILLLLSQSPSKDLLDRFWHFCLSVQGLDEQEVPIKKVVDAFHYVIVTLLRADIFTLIYLKKLAKVFDIKNLHLQDNPKQKQAMQNWFKSFLYERKAISRSQIIQLKSDGILNFENAGKILNELCSYNEEQQMFNFSYSKAFKNNLNQFPLVPLLQGYESIYSNNIHFGQQIQIQQQSISNILLREALNTKVILEIVENSWKKSLLKQQFAEGQEKYGYLYLFLLVVYDILTNGKVQSLRQKLQTIRKQTQTIDQYTSFESEKEKIKRLLNIDQEPAEMAVEKKLENVSAKKILSEQKKKKIAQNYLKRRQIVLQRVRSQNDGKMGQEEQLCILCHERQKMGNQLVYLSTLLKNNTIAGAIHGKNNIPNTYIGTCFHAVHINCYISFRKNSQIAFNCPLCQTLTNCILPTNYNRENAKLNRICKNVMIANMVSAYQIYDVESDFILLFKHLVQSKGLNSLLQYTRYEQKKKSWIRADEFLKELMIEIYETSNEEKKKEHLKSIEDFILEINSCPKTECLLVQLLFAEGLKQVLACAHSHNKIQAILLKIRGVLEDDQFMIIHEQICRLLQHQFELPKPSEDEICKKKCRLSFELVRLPESAVECSSRYVGKPCGNCEQNNEYLCLLCDKLICSNCRESHSKNEHNEASIYLATENLKVELVRKNVYSNEDIYENEFKIAYSERGDYEQMGSEDQYVLNDIKLQKLVGKFLEN